jgi:hypothetical protein
VKQQDVFQESTYTPRKSMGQTKTRWEDRRVLRMRQKGPRKVEKAKKLSVS